ncbi:MAG: hypothetical protein EGQ20_07405 [Bacteroides oleiciplenus]|nr:hypothetical protein [Bacteroides oleiciplenus]
MHKLLQLMCTNFFSSLFLHKERDNPDTGKGPLHYFREIFLFFEYKKKSIYRKFLSRYPAYLMEMFRKRKEKKLGGCAV